jgi:hypothetical protein
MAQAQATILQEINGLYVAVYGRAADGPGITYWCGTLGVSVAAAALTQVTLPQQIALGQAFVNTQSTYFLTLYPTTMNDITFVQQLYTNIGGNTGDAGGIAYWFSLLQAAEGPAPTAAQITAARAAIVGQFTYGLLSTDLTVGAAALGLSASDYAAAVARQAEFQNKISVSQFYADESNGPNGGILVAASTSSAAFTAAQEIVAGVTNNASTVTAADAAISAAVAADSLTPITTFASTPPVGTIFTLTTGVDAAGLGAFVSPITGNNNLVIGTNSTLTPGDQIIAAAGSTGNTLTLADAGVGGAYNPTNIAGVTVSNISTFNIASSEAVTANTATGSEGFTGLTALNVISTDGGANVDTITAAATTSVTVTDTTTAAVTANLTVNGGSTVTISEANGTNDSHARTITVLGGTGTTTVSVTQTETNATLDQAVTITDTNEGAGTKAGVITSVTLNGLDAQATAINDSALANLSISNVAAGGDTVTITEGAWTSPATTLNLTLSADKALTVNDAGSKYTTLAITTGATASTLTEGAGFTAVTAETVAGASVLTQHAANMTALKTIAISGAAGLTDSDLNNGALAALVTVTDTSSGAVTVSLTDTLTAFSGATGTGTEIVTITADATKAITGDGVATSEVVFNNTAATFTSTFTGANVTGFKVLGVGASGSGTFNIAASPFTGYTSLDDQGSTTGAVSFTNVTAGTPLAIDAANSGGTVTYQLATAGTASTAVNVTIGLSAAQAAILGLTATAGGFSVVGANQLTLWDSNFVGIANVNFTVNNATAGSAETINLLNDQSLASMSVAGTGDLTITTTYTDTLAALSIADNSTSTAGLTFAAGITDNALTTLAFAGSNTAAMTIGTLTDSGTSLTVTDSYAGNVNIGHFAGSAAMATESFTNTGAGTLTVGNASASDTALQSLTLVGNVSDFHGTSTGQDTYNGGITVTGGTDNAAVTFETTAGGGANAAGKVDSITLGNGNDIVLDAGGGTALGTINITLGTGADTVTVGTATTSGTNTVIFGAHTFGTADAISVGATAASTTVISTITGLNSILTGSDTITFLGDGAATGAVVNESAAIGTYLSTNHLTATLLNDVAAVLSASGGNLAQHAIGEFVFSGTQYVIEQAQAAGTALGGADTLVALVGTTVTAASSAAAGILTLHG